MRRFAVATLVCALVVGAWTNQARAGKWDIGTALMLGMGGDISVDVGVATIDADLEVTAGFGLFVDYEIWKYIDIGAQANVLFWKLDGGKDRDTWIDIAPFIKGKYRFLNDKLEVYGKFPIGFTLNIGDDTDAGMHTGLLFGVSYNVWSGLWPFLELGWALHWIDAGRSFTANQFALNIGASWSF